MFFAPARVYHCYRCHCRSRAGMASLPALYPCPVMAQQSGGGQAPITAGVRYCCAVMAGPVRGDPGSLPPCQVLPAPFLPPGLAALSEPTVWLPIVPGEHRSAWLPANGGGGSGIFRRDLFAAAMNTAAALQWLLARGPAGLAD